MSSLIDQTAAASSTFVVTFPVRPNLIPGELSEHVDEDRFFGQETSFARVVSDGLC